MSIGVVGVFEIFIVSALPGVEEVNKTEFFVPRGVADGLDPNTNALAPFAVAVPVGDNAAGERVEDCVRNDVSTRDPRFKTPNQQEDNPISEGWSARASSAAF